MTKFSSEQIKEILAIHENTLMKFFTSSLKTGADFQNKWFEEIKRDLEETRAKDPIEEDIKLIEQKHQQLEEKFLSLKIDLDKITYSLVGLLRRLKVLKRGKKVRI